MSQVLMSSTTMEQYVSFVLTVSLLALAASFWYRPSRSKFPEFGGSNTEALQNIVRKQWSQMRGAIYLLRLPFRKIYVLPHKYVNEYVWKPDDQVSSNTDLQERLLGRWTYIGSLTPDDPEGPYNLVVEYVRTELTKQISFYLPSVQDDIAEYFHEHVSPDSDKTTLAVHDFCIALCFSLYQRIFVGGALAKDPEWKAACVDLGLSSVGVAGKLMRVPVWLRPIAAMFMKGPRDVKANVRRMEDLIRPILEIRLNDMRQVGFVPPRDFIQWWIQKSISVGRRPDDISALVVALIQLNFAGIRSTGLGVMQSFIDIAVYPEYTDDLRGELQRVRSANGDHQETLTVASLLKLEKMDSFVKESARHVSQNVLSVYRKTLRPLHLSDGTVLPSSSYVCVPSIDPDADRETALRPFDGFRWYRQRLEQPDQNARFLSVSTNPQALEFGAGSHACPGRFLAIAVIKAAISHAITHFELRLPSAQKPKAPQYNHVLVYTPDTQQTMIFIRREHTKGT